MAKAGLGLEITELRLGLPGGDNNQINYKNPNYVKKRVFSEIDDDDESNIAAGSDSNSSSCSNITGTKNGPAPKNQVVGWPPVCSYRKKNSFNIEASKKYVKVSMDGAPFLRKIDLGLHKDYSDLAVALEKLFACVGIHEALMDAESSEYAPIYEDKDGDWMLAGDVPWEMFIESCKRLRIMKRSEAKGFGFMQTRAGGDLIKGFTKIE